MSTPSEIQINTKVSPSLHPENVRALAAYDDDTAHEVQHVVNAFEAVYEAVSSVHAARAAALSNPSLTEAAQILQVASFAEKRQAAVLPKLDSALRSVDSSIENAERELNRPLQSSVSSVLATEIRQHVARMDQGERSEFMRRRIEEGDIATLSAVLGAPSYLTNMQAAERTAHVRAFNSRRDPLAVKRLDVLQQASALLGERSGIVLLEFQKAVGAPPAAVARLRARVAAAERAFK